MIEKKKIPKVNLQKRRTDLKNRHCQKTSKIFQKKSKMNIDANYHLNFFKIRIAKAPLQLALGLGRMASDKNQIIQTRKKFSTIM